MNPGPNDCEADALLHGHHDALNFLFSEHGSTNVISEIVQGYLEHCHKIRLSRQGCNVTLCETTSCL